MPQDSTKLPARKVTDNQPPKPNPKPGKSSSGFLTENEYEADAQKILGGASLGSLIIGAGIKGIEKGKEQHVGQKILDLLEQDRRLRGVWNEKDPSLTKRTAINDDWNKSINGMEKRRDELKASLGPRPSNKDKAGQAAWDAKYKEINRLTEVINTEGIVPPESPSPKPKGDRTTTLSDSKAGTGTLTVEPTNATPVTGSDRAVPSSSRSQIINRGKARQIIGGDTDLQKQIRDIVAKEVDRLKGVTERITRPVTDTVTASKSLRGTKPVVTDVPTAVNKSVTRQQIKTEKAAGNEAAGQARAEAVKAKESADRNVGAAQRNANQARSNVTQSWNDLAAAKTGAFTPPTVFPKDVAAALEMRLPDVKRERSRLVTQRNQMQSSLGEKPKTGRTAESRQALTEWNAKSRQIRALNEQIAKLDAVVTPSGSPRPATADIINNPGYLTKEGAGQLGGVYNPQGAASPDVIAAKDAYRFSLADKSAADTALSGAQQAASSVSIPPPYAQPMGLGTTPVPKTAVDPVTGAGFLDWQHMPVQIPGQEFDPGRDPYSALNLLQGQGSDQVMQGPTRTGAPLDNRPLPNAGGRSNISINDIVDPTGLERSFGAFDKAVDAFRPDESLRQTQRNLGSLAVRHAAIKGDKPAQKEKVPLWKRIVNMMEGGSLGLAETQQNSAKASNDIALSNFTKTHGRSPDMSSAEDLAALSQHGYKTPGFAPDVHNQTGVVDAKGMSIDLPRTRMGMRKMAYDLGSDLNLKGTGGNLNPKLFDIPRIKGAHATIGSGLVGLGIGGYQFLEGRKAEAEAKAQAEQNAATQKSVDTGKQDRLKMDDEAAKMLDIFVRKNKNSDVKTTAAAFAKTVEGSWPAFSKKHGLPLNGLRSFQNSILTAAEKYK